jgi:hypothetical protein
VLAAGDVATYAEVPDADVEDAELLGIALAGANDATASLVRGSLESTLGAAVW